MVIPTMPGRMQVFPSVQLKKTEQVTVQVVAPNHIHVLDRGPGIKPDHRKFIFRRFWRKDRQGRGHAGLGLAIVAKIAQLHGGAVNVTDRPGGGSVFELSLGQVPGLET